MTAVLGGLGVVAEASPTEVPAGGSGPGPVLAPMVLPCINLMPPEIAEQARLRKLQLVLAAGLVATVGVVGALYAGAAASVDAAERELAASTARGAALQADVRTFSDVNEVHDRAAASKAVLSLAMGSEVRFSGLLDDLSKTVPEHVWLKDVTFTLTPPVATAATTPGIGTATFTGVGFRHDDVAVWLETLAAQEGFADPYVSDAVTGKIGERRTVSFTSTVTLTSDALSGRYAPEGS